ncbi:MAG: hypothetical protein AB4050_14895 [Synechococcus sp.]
MGLGLVACGASAPHSVVDSALQFEIAHATDTANTLVGIELLEEWSQVRSVKVRTQRPTDLQVDGESYPGIEVSGTYTLAIRTPNQRSRYKRIEPFTLTLIPEIEPETGRERWLLAQPQPSATNTSISEWTLVDFLPTPELSEPPPALSPTDEPPNSKSDESAIRSNLSESSQLSSGETSDIAGAFEQLSKEQP